MVLIVSLFLLFVLLHRADDAKLRHDCQTLKRALEQHEVFQSDSVIEQLVRGELPIADITTLRVSASSNYINQTSHWYVPTWPLLSETWLIALAGFRIDSNPET